MPKPPANPPAPIKSGPAVGPKTTVPTPIQSGKVKLPWYKNPVELGIIILVGTLYVSGNVWLYFKYFGSPTNNTTGKQSIFSTMTKTGGGLLNQNPSTPPTPTVNTTLFLKPKPIATGKQEFVVSGGSKTGPRFSKIIVSPLNPKKDEVQTVDVYVTDTTDVKSVTLTVKSDKKLTPHTLKLKEGDAKKGVWTGSWKIEDTYDLYYMYIIEAESASGKNRVEPVFR